MARFGERTDRLVRFEQGGRRVALGVAGASRVDEATVDGAAVTYPGVFDGADLRYVVTPEGVKENIVLPEPIADPTFRFTLQVAGVTAVAQGDGSVGFYANETPDGPPVLVIPRPFMTDSKADAKAPYGRSFSDNVTQSVEQHGATVTVTVRADKTWLGAAEREYPVVIDPTIRARVHHRPGRPRQLRCGLLPERHLRRAREADGRLNA